MSKFTTNINLEEISKDKNELKRYISTIYTMENYTNYFQYFLQRIDRDFQRIGPYFLNKLSFNYKDRINYITEAIKTNQNFLNLIIKNYKPDESYYKQFSKEEISKEAWDLFFHLRDSVPCYTIRDWSIEKSDERIEHYKAIIDEVKKYFKEGAGNYKFLIPGAGQCRLGYEISKFGFDVESNDYSFFNVMISEYIFNHTKKNEYYIQPLIHTFCDALTEDGVFTKYNFPDVDIDLNNNGKMTMSVGDFTKIYKDKKEYFDCVVTCFFIDTAKNIIEYVEVINEVLKKGGVWINFGPLFYHWTDTEGEISIELPYDKLKEVIINYGFDYVFETKKTVIFCKMENCLSNDVYDCIFFSCVKK